MSRMPPIAELARVRIGPALMALTHLLLGAELSGQITHRRLEAALATPITL